MDELDVDMLWTPLRLRSGITFRNRFIMAPMTTDASNLDGTVSESELRYIERRCATDFAAAITSCAYVEEAGKAWQGIGAASDMHLKSLERLASAIKCSGGLAILQLYDGGRLCPTNLVDPMQLRAPSSVASSRPNSPIPREMSSAEIEDLLHSFQEAAIRGRDVGFDGIELHGANHYLIHQFFSPRSNRRDDKWGGSLERRMEFPLAAAAAIREGVHEDMILGFRITPFEVEPGGIVLDDSLELCDRLASQQIDYIHVSLDNLKTSSAFREVRDWTQPAISINREHPVTAIANRVNTLCAVMGVGGIRSTCDARYALETGADLVAVARAVLVDPEWLNKVKNGREAEVVSRLPIDVRQIASLFSIPPRMVQYILSRPGWIPRDSAGVK